MCGRYVSKDQATIERFWNLTRGGDFLAAAFHAISSWGCTALACAMLGAASHGLAQGLSTEGSGYPAKAIRLIVPLAPGGGGDIMARMVGQRLAENMRQAVIVDNRAGGATMIGTEIVA